MTCVAVAQLAVALFAIAPLASARSAAAQQPVAEPDTGSITPAMVEAGRAIFHGRGTCFACHGMKLEGGPVAPTLLAHAWRDAKNGDYKAIIGVVSHGVPGTAMVAYPGGIAKSEVPIVAAYVWSATRGRVKP